jgi:pyruvate,water dikinase
MSLKDLMRLRVAEILDGTIPTKEEIENRKKDYFLATVAPGSTIFTADRKEIARLKEQYIDQPVKGGEVRGTVAFKGRVQGRVRLVVRRKDFDGVLEGDVLVTAMTTPDMMTIMKKAIAFITDEGGVTCHAAIIAREMRKPCIIGTKIATQVLKDGDLVKFMHHTARPRYWLHLYKLVFEIIALRGRSNYLDALETAIQGLRGIDMSAHYESKNRS